ncbi:hypothetical protein RB195_016977 [Necator americanus]|uniref:Uncharacterized protein n=1 Tax=Necator americanus TaxID=51031 RepID=A0ABR1C300_NECAM
MLHPKSTPKESKTLCLPSWRPQYHCILLPPPPRVVDFVAKELHKSEPNSSSTAVSASPSGHEPREEGDEYSSLCSSYLRDHSSCFDLRFESTT